MKNLMIGMVLLFVLGLFSSCSHRCSGNWYNNRNVKMDKEKPAKQFETLAVIDYKEIKENCE